MGSLERRLRALEEQAGPRRHDHPDDGPLWEKEDWLARARFDRNRAMDENTRHARALIRLFRTQDRLSPMSAEELMERIVSWQPVPDGGRSRATAEREVALAIYNRQEGTQNMVCPPEWRESFIAADELRARWAVVPDEVVAGWAIARYEPGELGSHDLGEQVAAEGESYGITDDLISRAIGPDYEELADEEVRRRFRDILAEDYYGERGYRIVQHMKRLTEKEKGATSDV